MHFSFFPLVVLLALLCKSYAQPYMGPASFAWPLPREWNRTSDNVPPCGSASVGPRSLFPLHRGYVALVSQYKTRNLEMKVSYMLDPKSVADFEPLIERRFSEYGVGYACVKVPDAPYDTQPGTNATFQLRYASDYDSPSHRSFFVCADITYVEPNDVDYVFPCVNTTDLELEPQLPKKKKPEEPKPPTEEEWSPVEKKKFVFEHWHKLLIAQQYGDDKVLQNIVPGILSKPSPDGYRWFQSLTDETRYRLTYGWQAWEKAFQQRFQRDRGAILLDTDALQHSLAAEKPLTLQEYTDRKLRSSTCRPGHLTVYPSTCLQVS
ncbi:hypothetical protein GGI43DRAFT_433424 [Trichoderma evansii]